MKKTNSAQKYLNDLEALLSQTEERAERAERLTSSDRRKPIITAVKEKWGSEPPDWIVPRLRILCQKMAWEPAVKILIEEIKAA